MFLKHFNEKTVVICQCFKNVCRFNCLAALGPRAFHRALEQVGRVRSNAKAFADMLLPAVSSRLSMAILTTIGSSDSSRIAELNISGSSCMRACKNMFNRNEILVPLARLVQRMFQNALAAFAKFIFVCT